MNNCIYYKTGNLLWAMFRLCGAAHGFMPIVVQAVPEELFVLYTTIAVLGGV